MPEPWAFGVSDGSLTAFQRHQRRHQRLSVAWLAAVPVPVATVYRTLTRTVDPGCYSLPHSPSHSLT